MTQQPEAEPPEADLGGDPACWLDRVCPTCGAFRDDAAVPCPRCGDAAPAET